MAERSEIVIPEHMKWEPWWRDKGDCGPMALYVLMRMDGRDTSVQKIKELIPFDSVRGCSLRALCRAAEQLGFPTEARFVKPQDLPRVPRPFVVHGTASLERNTGSFLVVVDYSRKERNYAVIDTEREVLQWVPEGVVLRQYSGYVLVPKSSITDEWIRHIGRILSLLIFVGSFVGGASFIRAVRYVKKSPQLL